MGNIITFAGIDPGATGYMCLLQYKDSILHNVEFIPYGNMMEVHIQYRRTLGANPCCACIIERSHAHPKQGITSAFTFGTNFGKWLAFLEMRDIPHQLLTPGQWQKIVITEKDKSESGKIIKKAVESVCHRLFPRHHCDQLYITAAGNKGKYQDGKGDAMLLAYVAMQLNSRLLNKGE